MAKSERQLPQPAPAPSEIIITRLIADRARRSLAGGVSRHAAVSDRAIAAIGAERRRRREIAAPHRRRAHHQGILTLLATQLRREASAQGPDTPEEKIAALSSLKPQVVIPISMVNKTIYNHL